jgi:ABC-2 type transport system permease protein
MVVSAPSYRQVLWHFARLRLRLLRNGFRGRTSRVLLFTFGVLLGLYLAGAGFALLAASSAGEADARLMVASFSGTVLVLGSAVLPLVWFGVDDTLDPARFALLPLSRRRLVGGLLVAAALGVPAAAVLHATSGLLVPAAVHGGVAAVAAQAAGVVLGLLLCLAVGRAVTSAFAAVLRSRRVRDLAWVLIASLAALLGPLQFAVISATQSADRDQLVAVARTVGWTPLAAPYTVGLEVAEGRVWAAVAKLAVTGVALAAVVWWWSRSIESALAGAVSGAPSRGRARVARGGPSAQLLPRPLPATAFGAVVAREGRYWWRDAKRRSNLILVVVLGLFLPVALTAGTRGLTVSEDGAGFSLTLSGGPASPLAIHLTMLLVGAFAASALANQFGFDGTAYATHLTVGVPGRLELRARAVAYSAFVLPLLLGAGLVVAVMQGTPAVATAAWGVLLAGYGTGLAINLVISVLGAYPLPESSNPFATGSGSAMAKSLLALLALVATGAATVPVLVTAVLLERVWPWIGLPAGLAYGLGAVALGSYLAGDLLDRRGPELLAAVTPDR